MAGRTSGTKTRSNDGANLGFEQKLWAAVDRLRPESSPACRPLLTDASGAMEKNVEIFIGPRFKRWGMCRTRRGACCLLKLRLWIYRFGEKCFEALNSSAPQLTNA